MVAFGLILVILSLQVNKTTKAMNKSSLNKAFTVIAQSFEITNYEVLIIDLSEKKIAFDVFNIKSMEMPILVKDKQGFYNKTDSSALMFFDSINSIVNFNSFTNFSNEFSKNLDMFVYCENLKVRDLLQLQSKNLSKPKFINILSHQYFIILESTTVKLFTFVWYSSSKCRAPQLIETNRFNENFGKWEKTNFTINKFRNFYGCNVTFGLVPSYVFYKKVLKKKGIISYGTLLFDIVQGLDSNLNYKFNYHVLEYLEKTPEYLKIDIEVHSNCLSTKEKNFFITQPYIFTSQHLLIPPGENFTPYEKLFLPFDFFVWSLITLVFFMTFVTIGLVNLTNEKVQRTVFGTNVKTPSLNIAIIFFGLSMNVLPRKNFSRVILMIFILYSLIIRTAWQGKMFEFMQKNITKSEVHSIEEMLEKNYTFYLGYNLVHFFKDSELVKR